MMRYVDAVKIKMEFAIRNPLIQILLIGLVVRLVTGVLFTYIIDIDYWIQTSANIDSGLGLYDRTGYYYTPIWGYYIGFTTAIGNMMGIDMGSTCTDLIFLEDVQYSIFTIPSLSYALLVKIPLMLCDLVVGFLIYNLINRVTKNEKRALIGCAVWMFCPLVIFASSIQGMFDTIMIAFMLISLTLLMGERYFLSGAALSLAVFTKLFPILLVPVFVAYVLVKSKGDTRKAIGNLLKSIGGFLIAMFLVMLPMIITGTVSQAFSFFTSRMETAVDSMSSILAIFDYSLMTYLSPFVILICVLLAYFMYKSKKRDKDDLLLMFSLFSLSTMFILPAVTQYYLILLPFLAYFVTSADNKYSKAILIILAFIFAFRMIQCNTMLLYTLFTSLGWDISGLIEISKEVVYYLYSPFSNLIIIAKIAIIVLLAMFAAKVSGWRGVNVEQ